MENELIELLKKLNENIEHSNKKLEKQAIFQTNFLENISNVIDNDIRTYDYNKQLNEIKELLKDILEVLKESRNEKIQKYWRHD